MAVIKPTRGQANWDVTLNAALDSLDVRIVPIETIASATKTATSTGVKGEMAYDATYLYVCVATNTWIRVARTAW
jgi:predicted nucleic acid-binding protein